MKTARQLLIDGLKAMGADGLYSPIGECGCGIDDLEPCDCINLNGCRAAIRKGGRFYPEEEEQ